MHRKRTIKITLGTTVSYEYGQGWTRTGKVVEMDLTRFRVMWETETDGTGYTRKVGRRTWVQGSRLQAVEQSTGIHFTPNPEATEEANGEALEKVIRVERRERSLWGYAFDFGTGERSEHYLFGESFRFSCCEMARCSQAVGKAVEIYVNADCMLALRLLA